MEEYTIFSERLKETMKHRNDISQRKLAEEIGISEVTLSRYINGQRIPKAPEIAKIAIVLHVSCDYLLGIDNDLNGHEDGTIDVKKALEYCEGAANGWHDFQLKAMDNIGHGDSYGHSFGAVAYGAQQENMFRWEIPNLLRLLSKER